MMMTHRFKLYALCIEYECEYRYIDKSALVAVPVVLLDKASTDLPPQKTRPNY